ncbi:MAG: glycosyltransferase family 2 protein [Acidimicrobiales bacterium]
MARPELEGSGSPFTVVICSRNRPDQLLAVLGALRGQTGGAFPVLVVDQSDECDPRVANRVAADTSVTLVRDHGKGLSRARNLAWPRVTTEWVVYLDDDCLPEPGWAAALGRVLAHHPDVGFVSGHVGGGATRGDDYPTVTVFPVATEQVRAGRWTRPWHIGFGVCMAVRRSVVEQLGGWDERLGAGVDDFPAAEDMDFNYRYLRGGGVALATPDVRATHEQWRSLEQLGPLYRGYMTAWAGFAVKHLRGGDVAGGCWLWLLGLADPARMFASGLRRRSPARLRLARTKLAGVLTGTVRALGRRW